MIGVAHGRVTRQDELQIGGDTCDSRLDGYWAVDCPVPVFGGDVEDRIEPRISHELHAPLGDAEWAYVGRHPIEEVRTPRYLGRTADEERVEPAVHVYGECPRHDLDVELGRLEREVGPELDGRVESEVVEERIPYPLQDPAIARHGGLQKTEDGGVAEIEDLQLAEKLVLEDGSVGDRELPLHPRLDIGALQPATPGHRKRHIAAGDAVEFRRFEVKIEDRIVDPSDIHRTPGRYRPAEVRSHAGRVDGGERGAPEPDPRLHVGEPNAKIGNPSAPVREAKTAAVAKGPGRPANGEVGRGGSGHLVEALQDQLQEGQRDPVAGQGEIQRSVEVEEAAFNRDQREISRNRTAQPSHGARVID